MLAGDYDHFADIEILDINGIIINSVMWKYGKIKDGIITINIGDMTPGIYLCQVKIEGKMAVKNLLNYETAIILVP